MREFALSSLTLCQREIVRFLRQRHRIVGALATPLVFWVLIGSGLGRSFQPPAAAGGFQPGGSYLQYFFPGTLVMILLFTAIFSTISIIEDRREGFLQAVLISPAPRSAIAMGKILGGTLLALLQGLLFALLAPTVGIHIGLMASLTLVFLMFVCSFALTALGFVIAWRMDSTQGFHAIMNLFLMPMWFLSGALFPLAGAPVWLQWVMRANPLTYGVTGLHQIFFHTPVSGPNLLVAAVFGVVLFGLSCAMVNKKD